MAWQPAYPAINFGLPLIDNLIAIFNRDQAEALAWANGNAAMTSFVRIHKCERIANKFPALAIIPISEFPDFLEDGGAKIELEFAFEIANSSDKPDDLTEDLRKRVAAVRQMIEVATPEDITDGIQVNTHSPLLVTQGKALYEQVRESEQIAGLYYRSVFLTVTFQYLQNGG